MRKMTFKMGASIVIYAMILTAVFVTGLYLFRSVSLLKVQNAYSNGNGVYILTQQEWLDSLTDDEITISPGSVTGLREFQDYYTVKAFDQLPIAIVFFCLFSVTSIFLLWRVLRHIQQKETVHLIGTLKVFEDEEEEYDSFDPLTAEALKRIRQKFRDGLEDYKRLNSYVSHEQKNSIAILKANLEIKGDAASLKILDRISDGMEDILTLSDNTGSSVTNPVDVALVCAAICDSYKSISNQIRFDFDDEKNTIILARQRWIYRAVGNLLDNALKYGAGKPVEVFVRNKNKSVIVTVRDFGIGISKEKQEQIFQNRYRVNELNQDGYGIGLSLVAHVCKLCNGFVLVKSEKNKGSCFYLAFPEFNDPS